MKKNLLLIFIFSALFNVTTLFSQVADFTISSVYMCNAGDSTTVTDASPGSPLAWLWSVSPTTGVVITNNIAPTTNITFNNTGTYTITLAVTYGIGTSTVSHDVYVNVPPPTPDICMVTCDANSVNNIIYWDKTNYANVDSVIVYREVSPLVFAKIAAISNDSLSEYIDTSRSIGPANGDPNAAAYRYKIQIKDLCGNVSGLSPYHTTIYISDDGLGQFSWGLPYSIEGAPNPVTNYILLCDTAGVNVWSPAASVSGSASNAVDPGFASHSAIANWRVKTGWSISCTPTRAALNTTRSNIKGAALTTGIGNYMLNSNTKVYPNPATNEITIELPDSFKSANIRIMNALGQTLFYENGEVGPLRHINTSAYSKGIYTISIESNGSKVFKKLVVN